MKAPVFVFDPITRIDDFRIAGVDPFSNKPFVEANQLYLFPYDFARIFLLLGNINDPAWSTFSAKTTYVVLSSERVSFDRYDIDCEVTKLARAALKFPRQNNILFYGSMSEGKALEVKQVTWLQKKDGSTLSVYHYGYVDAEKHKAEIKRRGYCPRYALVRDIRWKTGLYLQREVRRPSCGVARAFFICYNRIALGVVKGVQRERLSLVKKVDTVCRKGMDNHALLGYMFEQLFLLLSDGDSVSYTPIVLDLLFETCASLFAVNSNTNLGYMKDLFHLFCVFVLIPVVLINQIPLGSECEAVPQVVFNQSGVIDEFVF